MDMAAISIGAAEAKQAASKHQDFEARCDAAMRHMHNFWLSTDEDLRFRGAVGGLIILYDEEGNQEMVERITTEVKALQSLSALISGTPVNIERMVADAERHESLGLMKRWQELKQ
jgi:hypothetical protein